MSSLKVPSLRDSLTLAARAAVKNKKKASATRRMLPLSHRAGTSIHSRALIFRKITMRRLTLYFCVIAAAHAGEAAFTRTPEVTPYRGHGILSHFVNRYLP